MVIINSKDSDFSLKKYIDEREKKIIFIEFTSSLVMLSICSFLTYFLHSNIESLLTVILKNYSITTLKLMSVVIVFIPSYMLISKSIYTQIIKLKKSELATFIAVEYNNRLELRGIIPAELLGFVLEEFRKLKPENQYISLDYKESQRYGAFSVLKRIEDIKNL